MNNSYNSCRGACNISTSYNPVFMQYIISSSVESKKVNSIVDNFKKNTTITNNNFLRDNYVDSKKGIYELPKINSPNAYSPGPNYSVQRAMVPLYSTIK